ncbi:MAG: hypothetical protein ACYC9I_07465 [Desulfuromonadales bacterium]
MIKTNWILTIALVVGVLAPGASHSRGTADIRNTKHNLSSTPPVSTGITRVYYSDNEDEICIFCHTPHGGNLDGPLWNRGPSSVLQHDHYTSSTASAYLQGLGVARATSKESMLCLSCHDGSVSMFSVVNPGNRNGMPTSATSADAMQGTLWLFGPGGGGAMIGESAENNNAHHDLRDDHPISLDYLQVIGETGGSSKFRPLVEAVDAGVRFFPRPSGAQMLECSSCHDPHVNSSAAPDYAPFLITPNNGSLLCLACHKK